MARTYPFVWLDVFARTPLEGNQLAVFPDARGLSDAEMQAIARETHLSETTFVFPEGDSSDLEHGFATRIFAVFGEMPFAGHPTLGTANVLSQRTGSPEVSLRLKVGRIPVQFTVRDGLRFGEMVQNEPEFGRTHDLTAVAKALDVERDVIDPTVPIQTVSTGVPFVIVPFRTLDSLSRAKPSWPAMEEYLRASDARFFYLLAPEAGDPTAQVRARMIFSGGEDPATGSAAGPAIAWMVRHGRAKPEQSVVIEQGVEVFRKSLIHTRAALWDGRPTRVRVGGYCVPVIDGVLTL